MTMVVLMVMVKVMVEALNISETIIDSRYIICLNWSVEVLSAGNDDELLIIGGQEE